MAWEIILEKANAGNKPHHYMEHIACGGKHCPGMQARMELQQMRLKYKGEEDYTNC